MMTQHDSLGSIFDCGGVLACGGMVVVGVEGVTGLVTTGVSTSGDNRFMVARLWLLSIVLAASHLVDSNYFYKDKLQSSE